MVVNNRLWKENFVAEKEHRFMGGELNVYKKEEMCSYFKWW
jgi:hypothetical protein